MMRKFVQGAIFCALLFQGASAYANDKNVTPEGTEVIKALQQDNQAMKAIMDDIKSKLSSDKMETIKMWVDMPESKMREVEDQKIAIIERSRKNLKILKDRNDKDYESIAKETYKNLSESMDTMDKEIKNMGKLLKDKLDDRLKK